MTPPFTAALLAGGKSLRMGRDKVFLPAEWEGKSVPLWDRQLSVLKAVGPAELAISGPAKPGYPASVPVYADEWHDVGPLGGIATCLNRMSNGLLLVLAVDLPRVQAFISGKAIGRSGVSLRRRPDPEQPFRAADCRLPKSRPRTGCRSAQEA